MATSNCCRINHGIIVSIKLTQNKEDLSNDNTRTIGETHHKRKNKETKADIFMGIVFQIYLFIPWINITGKYNTIHMYLIKAFQKMIM